ncbi:hypothetical protein A2419_02900 [Candidatus Adlerbacteria bacterium RIFOXYC1_FULL_48_26]|uniref:Uncharacterized protein n=1 Tax=Candidatus Adlerbacteria bacterium RIFOXYC1_FULL_48_26 TaxID=1797247 RepID=A0A1F4Y411_9BACT|nr:MAG: hypothetical protein A2419_02900 [Candidatus Adlerbacteria bacterium RIFOXYC1_FULL_48_26]OGC93558.1 MAG: hypothetical protein A2389_00740 [Candidatus Adlerbacteria bacterium RIFOXYB1_FULL_48_10]OGC95109.1 MAG: hypothetical protein A2590_01815 [Candidatus Adlerbacteria bacterium RIFOXYD1_FULL_48_8]
MIFEKFTTEGDLRHFLRGCTAFEGGPLDIEKLERGPRDVAHLVRAIEQKREIEFGRDMHGNGVCRSRKSETLVRVGGEQLVERYREVNGVRVPTPADVVRTLSETGIEGETAEETLLRCFVEESGLVVPTTNIHLVSKPPIADFGDLRDRHKSSVYVGLWRQVMVTRFFTNFNERPEPFKERLEITDEDTKVFGEWEPETLHGPWDHSTDLWQQLVTGRARKYS